MADELGKEGASEKGFGLEDIGDAQEFSAPLRYLYTVFASVADRERLARKVLERDWQEVSKPLNYNAATGLLSAGLLYLGDSPNRSTKFDFASENAVTFVPLILVPLFLINHTVLSMASPSVGLFEWQPLRTYISSWAYCFANAFLWIGLMAVTDKYIFHILQDGPVVIATLGLLAILTLPLAFVEEIYEIDSAFGFYAFAGSVVGVAALMYNVYQPLGLL